MATKHERKPAKGQHITNQRDAEGRRANTVKGAWAKACFVLRTVQLPPDAAGNARSAKRHVPGPNHVSLKSFARTAAASSDDTLRASARDWLSNKRANTKAPKLGIGATRKKKGNQGNASAKAPPKAR